MAMMSLDAFGKMMDQVIKDAPVKLLIDMPEGTTEAQLKDNMGMGAVMQFYIILNAVERIFADLCEQLDLEDTDLIADSLCDLLKESMKGSAE